MGFALGLVVCLYYRLPIPPVFVTELGLLVGGVSGALIAVYELENRVIPTVLTLFVGAPACRLLGLSIGTGAVVLGLLTFLAWMWSDGEASESSTWDTV